MTRHPRRAGRRGPRRVGGGASSLLAVSNRSSDRGSAATVVRAALVAATATVLATTAVVVGGAFPAAADNGLGQRSGSGLTGLDTFLIFGAIPIAVFAVVIALVYGLSSNDEPRLREGQAWWGEPDYYSKGGADGSASVTADAGERPRTTDGGGTGATW